MKRHSSLVCWAAYIAVGLWGVVSFLVLFGESDLQHPMTPTRFFALKAAALASLYACFKVFGLLERKGLLPPIILKMTQEED